jgi:predicted amidohydrolase
LADNLEKILGHIEKSDCDFILFPEMALTGYHGDFSDKAARSAWEKIATACRQAYVTAIVGTGAREGDATYIQSRIFGDDGSLVGSHEKLVPTQSDREFCQPGEELRTFQHHGLTFGCLICNDLWVAPGWGPYPDPRLSYQLGKRNAQVIFHSINSGSHSLYIPFHDSNLRLRAIESKIYIATANAAVPEGTTVNAPTGVVSPEGEWVVQCPAMGEQQYVYDIELETD